MLRAFSETINVADPIPVASGPIDFEDKVQQIIVRMKELGYEPTIMQVRNFVRGIGQYGDLTEFIRQLEKEEEITNMPFSEKVNSELTMGSKQWQKLREEIKRWKKTGGVLKAKLKGKKGKETKKRIKELVAERGAKLTSEEMDEIATMPGVVPPWWEKKPVSAYYIGASKAIKELNVSAFDVHIAVERDYTDKPLNRMQKTILKVGWDNGWGND